METQKIKSVGELKTCKFCGGKGTIDCDHCEPNTHDCSDCGGTGERYTITMEELIADRASIHTSLVAAVEGLDTKYVPADMIWVGDEDYEVGEHKLFPAKDPSKAMYCLTCKRFLHEEGCTCGTVSVERVLTIINSIFKE